MGGSNDGRSVEASSERRRLQELPGSACTDLTLAADGCTLRARVPVLMQLHVQGPCAFILIC